MKMQITLVASLLAVNGLVSHRAAADEGVVSELCGTAAGTRFNLEPRVDATAQVDPAVDFLRNHVGNNVDLVLGASIDAKGAKYDVNRDDDCTPEFEGTLPKFPSAYGAEPLFAVGSPLVRFDASRNVAFIASPFTNFLETGLGVFRATSRNLLDPAACPAGRHAAASTATCWPTRVLVARALDSSVQSPSLAVDQRTSGIGAGSVYIAVVQPSDNWVLQLLLVACRNDLRVCAAPVVLATDEDVRFVEVSVRPDGRPSVTYVIQERRVEPSFKRWDDITYVSCTAATPPNGPVCTPSRLVHREQQPLLGGTVSQIFSVSTHPKHDHRVDANGIETYVTWERCRVPSSVLLPGNFLMSCPDADVVMKASADDGATWYGPACVDCGPEHQFLPEIRADRGRHILNIAYYSSEADTVYQKRLQVKLAQADPGVVTPDPITNRHLVTTLATDPQADRCPVCFASRIGLSARSGVSDGSGRAYIHFVFNNVQGAYFGVKMPDANNHLGRVDY